MSVQQPSAATYRRRRILVGTLALLVTGGLLWGGGFTVVTLARPYAAAAVTVSEPVDFTGEAANLALPETGRMALAASGFDGLIAHSGDQGEAPIASISKIVTALVILSAKPIDSGDGPTITFTDADVTILNQVIAEDGSYAAVNAGLELSERQALTAMLLPSANNYAISLAIWAFGSLDAYVTVANAWLDEQGLDHTRITEPSGLSPLNVSTPEDLVTLGQLAEANAVVADIVDEESADIPGVGMVENTNTLLGQAGIIGIKTGTTDEAGSCLLFAAEIPVGSQTVVLTGVLLGGDSHDAVDTDVLALVESATAAFREVVIASEGVSVASATTSWGQSSEIHAAGNISLVSFGDLPVTVNTSVANITTAAAGASVGTLTATSGSQSAQVELLTASALTDPGPWWRLTHADLLG